MLRGGGAPAIPKVSLSSASPKACGIGKPIYVSCCSWLPSIVLSVLALYPAAPERFHDLGMGLRGISFPESFRLFFQGVHVAFGGSYFE